MTLAVLALFADGTTRLDQHRQLARQGDRPHRRDGGRAAQDGRDGGRRRRLPRGHAARRAGAPPTIAHLRRPPHGDVPVAGRVQRRRPAPRPAQPVRILDPRCVAKTWPDYFEALFGVAERRRRRRSRCSPSTAPPRPARARWRARSPPRSATCCSTPARSTAPPRWPCCRPASTGRRRGRPRRARRSRWTCASQADRAFLAGADVSDSLRLEAVGALASRISAWPRVRQAAARRADWRSAACPAWSPTAATWARSSFPTPPLKVFLTASAARTGRAPAQAIDFKGDFC